ncbi:hypothetical protein [Providencia phage PSTCR6]|nr:hypothetical protein [Providencia phage PSTCR6]
MIQTVFATAPHPKGVALGSGNKLPWARIPQDMKNFASRTSSSDPGIDSYVIMGPKTFMGMPKLKNRISVIIINSPSIRIRSLDGILPDMIYRISPDRYDLLEDVCRDLEDGKNLISIIGGKKLIEEGVKISDQVIHTNILAPIINEPDVFISDNTMDELSRMTPTNVRSTKVDNGLIIEEILISDP